MSEPTICKYSDFVVYDKGTGVLVVDKCAERVR